MFKNKYFIGLYEDEEGEELVSTFESAEELAEYLDKNKKAVQGLISDVFNKRRKTLYGYRLEFFRGEKLQ